MVLDCESHIIPCKQDYSCTSYVLMHGIQPKLAPSSAQCSDLSCAKMENNHGIVIYKTKTNFLWQYCSVLSVA